MRVSQAEMEKSHERIVASAARLFRERGIENTSVADIMKDAGLTHGGFYRHFENKDALTVAALQEAFEQIFARLHDRKSPSQGARESFRKQYVSRQHADNPGMGCPIAALANDVARGTNELRIAFGSGVRRAAAVLSADKPGADEERLTQGMRELAMMAGAVMIARASDPETGRRILSACRTHQ